MERIRGRNRDRDKQSLAEQVGKQSLAGKAGRGREKSKYKYKIKFRIRLIYRDSI